ncbi:hypothetical protein CMI41_03430 [Candidatus Pacearchaeota archaeon]|nr:hypothetical protein [Candidatus Pacearchaeota archaeon]|tara:strand:+ start:12051 stop:12611 length:561 start_codon:yes stop_codon:yes gene_type:complete
MAASLPPGVPRATADEFLMLKAIAIATRSGCIRYQVGAIIADDDNRVVSSGYNGPSGKIESCSSRAERGLENPCYKDLAGIAFDVKNSGECEGIHAEENALYLAGRDGSKGNRMYVTIFPCMECARRIGANGIKEVIHLLDYPEKARALDILTKQGVNVRRLELPRDRAQLLLDRFYDQVQGRSKA